jgi:hypothetical protein
MSNSVVQELRHSHIVRALGKEFSDGDVILEELRHCGVQVLVHSAIEELSDSDIVAALLEELSDCSIVAALVEELGHRDVVVLEELGDRGVEVVCQGDAMLRMVAGEYLVEELSDCDVVASEVFGHSDAVLTVEELGDSDVVGGEELGNDVVEELSH